MKVTFNLDSGVNIHSCKSHSWDLNTEKGQKAFGYTKEEWISFSDDEKYQVCKERVSLLELALTIVCGLNSGLVKVLILING
jgi:hypothetical protein